MKRRDFLSHAMPALGGLALAPAVVRDAPRSLTRAAHDAAAFLATYPEVREAIETGIYNEEEFVAQPEGAGVCAMWAVFRSAGIVETHGDLPAGVLAFITRVGGREHVVTDADSDVGYTLIDDALYLDVLLITWAHLRLYPSARAVTVWDDDVAEGIDDEAARRAVDFSRAVLTACKRAPA